MNASLIKEIEEKMHGIIDSEQMRQLHQVLEDCLSSELPEEEKPDLVRLFLAAKRVEGCSEKTVKYYDSTIRNPVKKIDKDVVQITTDDLRIYLDEYQTESKISKVTLVDSCSVGLRNDKADRELRSAAVDALGIPDIRYGSRVW